MIPGCYPTTTRGGGEKVSFHQLHLKSSEGYMSLIYSPYHFYFFQYQSQASATPSLLFQRTPDSFLFSSNHSVYIFCEPFMSLLLFLQSANNECNMIKRVDLHSICEPFMSLLQYFPFQCITSPFAMYSLLL